MLQKYQVCYMFPQIRQNLNGFHFWNATFVIHLSPAFSILEVYTGLQVEFLV